MEEIQGRSGYMYLRTLVFVRITMYELGEEKNPNESGALSYYVCQI